MTISRIWHGYTTAEHADEFEVLLKDYVQRGLDEAGATGVTRTELLRRPLGDKIEFILIMGFDSIEGVKALFGEDYEKARLPAEARVLLVRSDERAQHYDVRDSRTYRTGQIGERVFSMESKPDTGYSLPDGAWFVRKDRGNGSVPVTREGYSVVMKFVLGMVGWAIAAAALAFAGIYNGPSWLTACAPVFFALGALLTAWYFIGNARKHTDFSIRYSEFLKARRHA